MFSGLGIVCLAGSRSMLAGGKKGNGTIIMNGLHFDTFVRDLPLGSSRRRLLAWALVGVASPATIAHFGLHDVEARRGGKKKKVTLCRAGQTVTVSKKARKKLLREGATVGACQGSSPHLATGATSASRTATTRAAGATAAVETAASAAGRGLRVRAMSGCVPDRSGALLRRLHSQVVPEPVQRTVPRHQ